jgi:acyl-coenzyme A thioesterase PaaI-like protein
MTFKETALLKKISNPLYFRFFLLLKLPAAFYSGIRLHRISLQEATASVPFKRFTTNPFKSTYFACLAMAAEMSTGVLATIAIEHSGRKISMLVTGLSARYHKKATTTTYFTCSDGDRIAQAIQQSINTGQGVEIACSSKGFNQQGELIAEFEFTWSFKPYK